MAGNKKVRYVAVAPCVPLGKRGQGSYTYYVFSEDVVGVGQVVKIPFGKRSIMGVVIKLDLQRPSYPTKQVKTITGVRLTSIQMQFAQWLADACHGGFGFTARLFLPGSFAKLKSSARVSPPARGGVRGGGIKKPEAIIEHTASARRDMVSEIAEQAKGQALILVPEVAILASYEKGFLQEIEDKTVMLYHAGLLQSEKNDVWQAVDSGECRIVIGTQKALFLPFSDLSLVCIDEEQSESYKLWDQYPRLHTVLGAQMLAELSGASLVYGSSYPSLFLRYVVAEKKCNVIANNPVVVTPHIYPFSFEDKKWKRNIPEELGSKVRLWARSGKHVLILFNKKDDADLRKSLSYKLSAIAKKHIYIGTVGILTHPPRTQFDHVVWLFPEWTLRNIDYRYSERARLLSARLAQLSSTGDVHIGSRYADIVHDEFDVSETVWQEKALKQRKRFALPPYADMVRISIRDKTSKKAQARAEDVRGMLDPTSLNLPAGQAGLRGASIRIYGPYQELGSKKKVLIEYHILLSGDLKKLIPLYKKLPVDSADVMPYKVV